MVGPRSRAVAWIALLAVLCAAGHAAVGLSELALYFGPPLVTIGLLLRDRYLGEERILARRARGLSSARRRAPRRLPRGGSDRPLASLSAPRICAGRAPPVMAAAPI